MNHPDPELALADVTWLTALARSLVRDEQLADDLVQETCMAAHRSPPKSGGVTRAWLGTVLRNFHRRSMRTSSRRARREQAVSKNEALQSTAELVEQAELRRKLAECLLSLEEPFRTTLMRIAFEQQTTAQIAKHDGVTTAAVRARLRKARALYKAKLERDYGGDWSKWQAALLPYASLPLPGVDPVPVPEPASPGPAHGAGLSKTSALGALMSTTGFVTATLLACTGTWLLWPSEPVEPRPPEELARTADATRLSSTRAGKESAGPERIGASIPDRSILADAKEMRIPGQVRVSGTLTVDRDGESIQAQEGSLFIYIGGERRSIGIHQGSFSFECEPGQTFTLDPQGEAEDRLCLVDVDAFAAEPVSEDSEISIRARWPRTTTLIVKDAATRAPISEVYIVPVSDRTKPEKIAALEPQSTPTRIEPIGFREISYAIRAEGYGWHKVELEGFQGGEREVLLQRGVAQLNVVFRGRGDREPLLSVVPVTEIGTFSASSGSLYPVGAKDSFTLDHLVPGDYQITTSPGYNLPLTGSVRALEIGANEVVVELPEPELVETGSVHVVLSMSAAWGDLRREVRFTEQSSTRSGETVLFRERDMTAVEGQGDTWSFDAGRLPVGKWTAEIEGLGWGIPVEIGPFQNTVRIDVPEPGLVEVRVTDAGSGEILTGGVPELYVSTWPLGLQTGSYGEARYDPDTKCWKLIAPIGKRGVHVGAPRYLGESTEVTFTSEPTRIEVALKPTHSIVFEVYEGEKRIPTDLFWLYECKVQGVDGTTGTMCGAHLEGVEQALEVSATGTYEIEFRSIDGYEPIPKARITVDSYDLLRHRVQVVRKK